jgi:hypothetical protein
MIGSRIQPRTLSTFVVRPGCSEGMRATVSNVDILVCSVEAERWQAGIRAIDNEVRCSVWWLSGAFL